MKASKKIAAALYRITFFSVAMLLLLLLQPISSPANFYPTRNNISPFINLHHAACQPADCFILINRAESLFPSNATLASNRAIPFLIGELSQRKAASMANRGKTIENNPFNQPRGLAYGSAFPSQTLSTPSSNLKS